MPKELWISRQISGFDSRQGQNIFVCNVYEPILGHTVSYIKSLVRSFSLPRNKSIKFYGLGSW